MNRQYGANCSLLGSSSSQLRHTVQCCLRLKPFCKVSHKYLQSNWLLKQCQCVLLPTLTSITNQLLAKNKVHPVLKEVLIMHLLKKRSLDQKSLRTTAQSEIQLSFQDWWLDGKSSSSMTSSLEMSCNRPTRLIIAQKQLCSVCTMTYFILWIPRERRVLSSWIFPSYLTE